MTVYNVSVDEVGALADAASSLDVAAYVQRFALDQKIELFKVDVGIYGGDVYYYANEAEVLSFAGQVYQPLPVTSDGWQRTGRGTLPRPTLTVSNVTGLFSFLNLLYGDLVGVEVMRTRVYAWALDGGLAADPTAILYPIDKFVIARKVHQDDETVQYELAARMDLEGREFPSRPMTQNYCMHIYRVWDPDASDFDYTNATCPYAGSVHRDTFGNVVEPALDVCAKTLPECAARFGTSVDLGYSGFPGVDRVRV